MSTVFKNKSPEEIEKAYMRERVLSHKLVNAIGQIYRAQVYEDSKRENGVSLELIGAIRSAAELAGWAKPAAPLSPLQVEIADELERLAKLEIYPICPVNLPMSAWLVFLRNYPTEKPVVETRDDDHTYEYNETTKRLLFTPEIGERIELLSDKQTVIGPDKGIVVGVDRNGGSAILRFDKNPLDVVVRTKAILVVSCETGDIRGRIWKLV